MKRMILYPYNAESSPIVRNKELMREYEIFALISPNGWGLEGKDASYVDQGYPTGMLVSSNLEGIIAQSDVVFLTDSTKQIMHSKMFKYNIDLINKLDKTILCTHHTYSLISNLLYKNTRVYLINDSIKYNELNNCSENKLYDINVPVIFVLGVTENTQKFHIQLGIRKELKRLGYKVSQVGTRNYCEFFGFHSFPQFMMGNELTETEKIIQFNHYIKSIEVNETPDVLLIGVPGGIMPLTTDFNSYFGITAFEVSQAISPDLVIMSILYDNYNSDYFNKLNGIANYRFNFDIDIINVSNIQVDWEDSSVTKQISYVCLDLPFIERKISELKFEKPVFSILRKNDARNLVENIVNQLEGYEDNELY